MRGLVSFEFIRSTMFDALMMDETTQDRREILKLYRIQNQDLYVKDFIRNQSFTGARPSSLRMDVKHVIKFSPVCPSGVRDLLCTTG